nr:40S ribosomal protein S2-like isoform X2 [Chlorocebus sabaeus]
MVDDAGAAGEPGGPGMGNRGGFRRGFSSGIRGRGRRRGRGQGRGRGACGGKAEDNEWMPVTKLGRLIKDMKIKSLEEIYLFSLPIKAFVAIGDYNGHVGLGVKCSKEVATTIRGVIILAKLSIVAVRRGWGRATRWASPTPVPCKVTGHCGSVLVCLIPAPRDTGILSAPVPKKLLMMAGIDDCYTSAQGCTATLGNFAKAMFDAISKTYSYLTPDLWKETVFTKSPYQEFTDHLVKTHTRVSVQWTQAPAVATT